MVKLIRSPKFSGMVAPDDVLHQLIDGARLKLTTTEQFIPPVQIPVDIVSPTKKVIQVAQYGQPVTGGAAGRYDPAGDCGGNFMSYKFQPNNNCYAYGSNIATNTFPQPGRRSGYQLTAANLQGSVDAVGEVVAGYAEKDGLILVGKSKSDLTAYKAKREGVTGVGDGHFVALMVSPATSDGVWTGDYHWARCDNSSGGCDSWSQKDGGDQVTNFDFAGNPITDPATANWTVNQGPMSNNEELVVSYYFYCYMFVPAGGVNII